LKTRVGRWAIALGAALVGCSSAALLYQTKPPPPDARPPRVTTTASASAPVLPPPPVALDQFTPLLGDPRFGEVAEALTLEDTRRAAVALSKLLASDASLRAGSIELWSGRLWERVGDSARALAACENARKAPSELTEYAELCAARALIELGRAREAFERVQGRAFQAPLETERRLLVARAARASGERERAISALRGALESELPRSEGARATLELAELLLDSAAPGTDAAIEPLTLVRRAGAVLASNKSERARSEELERRALALLSPEQHKSHAVPTSEQQLSKVAALLEAREYVLTDRAAADLLSSLGKDELYGAVGCEATLLRAKALAGLREFWSAAESLTEPRVRCSDPDKAARMWYLSGRYAASEGRWVHASAYFGELEKRHPAHSLTDDARYYSALAQQELGVESRFTELLLSLPDDYPTGDMTAEGLFRLALRRMERGTWSEAIGLLERGIRHLGEQDRERGLDLAGRERYFRARALLALGDRGAALSELEKVIERHPLAYYMVQAFSLLERLEPGRGDAALARARAQHAAEPFRIAGRAELDKPGFLRMMELLRIGELDLAVRELDALGLRGEGTGSEILWGIALLYERAGFSKFSADLAKRQLSEVVSRWPVGGWEKAWQIAFPRPHLAIVDREAKSAGIDSALVYAIMREESGFDAEAVSSANAYGLMQLIEPTAKMIAKSSNLPTTPAALKRPRVNVALGCRMLSRLAAGFETNPLLAIPAYNAGPGRARRWIRERPSSDFDLWVELIPYNETRRYTKRVLSSRAVYAFLYEPGAERSRLLLPAVAGKPPEEKKKL
jgi:soluble lytic murein transglycosylase